MEQTVKLPDIEDYFDYDGLEWQEYKKDLADWFKRCMEDRENSVRIHLDPWFENWFCQFYDSSDGTKTGET